MNTFNNLNIGKLFRIIAFLEGVSYILLILIGVPVKYVLNNPIFVQLLGMPHGILFIAYIALAIYLQLIYKWNTLDFLIILLASLVPFGTFYVDKKYLKGVLE